MYNALIVVYYLRTVYCCPGPQWVPVDSGHVHGEWHATSFAMTPLIVSGYALHDTWVRLADHFKQLRSTLSEYPTTLAMASTSS
jgi:hypothetical protein